MRANIGNVSEGDNVHDKKTGERFHVVRTGSGPYGRWADLARFPTAQAGPTRKIMRGVEFNQKGFEKEEK